MRKFAVSRVLTVIVLGSAVAGAGVVGTFGIVAPLMAGDPAPTARTTTASLQVSVDGRVPVRLKSVEEGLFRPARVGTVTFVRNQQRVQETSVLDGGTVQVDSLETGPYSVFVHGNDGYAAFSTWLVPNAFDGEPTTEILSVGLVPQSDMPTVRQIISSHRNITYEGAGQFSEPSREVALDSARRRRNIAQTSEFQLSLDGTLTGRVVRTPDPDGAVPFAGASVYFVHSNQIVSQTVADTEGLFQMTDMPTGVFSLVVAGEGAFLAMSVAVVSAQPNVASTGAQIVNEVSLTAFQQDETIVELSPVFQQDAIVVEEYFLLDDGTIVPVPPDGGYAGGIPGGGGGMAGGGGFGGGGAGLAAALGAAGLGVGIAALARDRDRLIVISPANPGPSSGD